MWKWRRRMKLEMVAEVKEEDHEDAELMWCLNVW